MLACLAWMSSAGAAPPALVVGNADYASLADLAYAAGRTRRVGRMLGDLGWDVTALEDADRASLLAASKAFGKRLRREPFGVVYLHGHFVQGDGRVVFLPADADADSDEALLERGVPLSTLLASWSMADVLVVLDTGRNHPLSEGWYVRRPLRPTVPLQPFDVPSHVVLLNAGPSASYLGADGRFTDELVWRIGSCEPVDRVVTAVRSAVRADSVGEQDTWIVGDPARLGAFRMAAPDVCSPMRPPEPHPGQLWVTPAGVRLRWIPAGTVELGRKPDGTAFSGDTIRTEEVRAQWVMDAPVTRERWQSLGLRELRATAGCGGSCAAHYISWYESVDLANTLSAAEGLTPAYVVTPGPGPSVDTVTPVPGANGYRLLTRAEWVFAAHGGESFKYPGSDDPEEVGWSKHFEPTRVCAFKANGYGLCDLVGPVSEWLWDPVVYRGIRERGFQGKGIATRAEYAQLPGGSTGLLPHHDESELGVRFARD